MEGKKRDFSRGVEYACNILVNLSVRDIRGTVQP